MDVQNNSITTLNTQSWSEEDLARMNQVLRHRIRNFVSGLKAAVSFLEQELKQNLSPSQLEYFPLIIKECDALAECTNRMNLLFDTLPSSEPDSLRSILLSAIRKVRERFPSLEILTKIPDDIAELTFYHKFLLSTAIEEGITNAAEAAPNLPINVILVKEQNRIVVNIIDKGKSSFTQNELQKMFLPFFTTKPRHLGLGLAIAKRFITYCEGTIELANNDSVEGTTLKITLPIQASSLKSSA